MWSPSTKAEWLAWEKAHPGGCETIARCSGCGRGYIWISKEGIGCLACGAPVNSIPPATPLPAVEETHE
jgi:hypothetical protein